MRVNSLVRRTVGATLVAATVGAAGLLTAAPSSAVPLDTFPGEVVPNGTGESTAGWTGPSLASVAYADIGVPTSVMDSTGAQVGTFDGGSKALTYVGTPAGATQTFNLPAAALAQIDAGIVSANVSAYFGGTATSDDTFGLRVRFGQGGLRLLGTFGTAAERGNTAGFVPRSMTVPVPPGTRSVSIFLNGVRTGTTFDTYLDNISLRLQTPAAGALEVTHTSDASGPVTDGQVVNYTSTFTNTGEQPVAVDRALALSGLLDDADLVSGPTSANAALSVTDSGAGVHGVTGTLAPGQSVTVTYSVAVKAFASQGDHNLVTVVSEPANVPVGVPASCAGAPLCLENAAAETAAVPLISPAVAGVVAAVLAIGAGGYVMIRRRQAATS
ncbi:DUF7927 domain-containing protein [Rhodococcus sp. OK302]|uniref:DUF7927 domain-containing protein n=1 Tax=Rhodococcus sp. OK302 TaxID=1882769 RepID=UPI0011404B63|nr:hypothetical protein [Rhodococcus sp. OK302]